MFLSNSMQPMLATDYGNFAAFWIGVPSLLLALLIGIPSGFFRVRALAVVCGLVCILAGVLFFHSLPDAKVDDRTVTIVFGTGSLVAGAALIFIKRKTRA